jgi:glycosyltransferase involved in cell wall biosynthesis
MPTGYTPILFLIRSLGYGGTDRQVIALATNLHQRGESVAVATFYSSDIWGSDLDAAGVRCYSLEKTGRWDFLFLFRLVRLVRQSRPAIIYSLLGTANIIGLLCKLLLPNIRMVWSVRASNMDLQRYGWLDRLVYRVECALSRFADLIIANSHAGLRAALEHGFPKEKSVVIANGIDTNRFTPDPRARETMRSVFGLAEYNIVIGLVGRLDPMKDHPTFLKAAALLAENREVRFLCVGDGPKPYQSRLGAMAKELGIDTQVIWLTAVQDMAAVYNAMDVMTSSSSFGEGFSNVIGEAMACGVPCVVTDVGDAQLIIGETGYVVPPEDPAALCLGWRRMLAMDPQAKSSFAKEARSRILRYYGLERLVTDTWDALKAIP